VERWRRQWCAHFTVNNTVTKTQYASADTDIGLAGLLYNHDTSPPNGILTAEFTYEHCLDSVGPARS